jgi:ureidoglycolate lyase
MKIKVERLSQKDFQPFGEVIGEPGVKPEISNPEVDVWPGISDVKLCGGAGQVYWLNMKIPRPFVCDSLEKHKTCGEVLIPIKGQSIAVFGLSKDGIADSEDLDPNTVKAFILDGSAGVNINKGVWHWLPFPISESTTFVAILEKNTHKDDLLIRDFKKEQDLSFELVL